MNKQEVFNKVATHLIKQGQRSVDHEAACLYRGPGNLMCAAGCLIEDEHYAPALENLLVRSTQVSRALTLSGVPLDAHQMVAALQELHDRNGPARWPKLLQELADDFNVEFEAAQLQPSA